jgi:hypothetical protein
MPILLRVAVSLFVLAVVSPAFAANGIDPFVGKYEGKSISQTGSEKELTARDLSVVIRKEGRAFSVAWTTVIYRAKGQSDRRTFKINFAPSGRTGIYGSKMATNVFGRAVAHDPLTGDPYFWASIRGTSLFVYGIHVTEEGGYEVQVYERKLTADGMSVRFSRMRDGEKQSEITGALKRTN